MTCQRHKFKKNQFSGTSNFVYANPRLALIMNNGSVWDIKSSDGFRTVSKSLLIQLPKSKPYFAFLTKGGVINFVRGDLSSNIIQYQEQLNHQKHTKIPKSSITFRKNDG